MSHRDAAKKHIGDDFTRFSHRARSYCTGVRYLRENLICGRGDACNRGQPLGSHLELQQFVSQCFDLAKPCVIGAPLPRVWDRGGVRNCFFVYIESVYGSHSTKHTVEARPATNREREIKQPKRKLKGMANILCRKRAVLCSWHTCNNHSRIIPCWSPLATRRNIHNIHNIHGVAVCYGVCCMCFARYRASRSCYRITRGTSTPAYI